MVYITQQMRNIIPELLSRTSSGHDLHNVTEYNDAIACEPFSEHLSLDKEHSVAYIQLVL